MREQIRRHELHESGKHLLRVLEHASWKRGVNVLLYAPLPGEPDPTLLEWHKESRFLVFPKIEGSCLGLYRQTEGSLWIDGPYGLQEPDPKTWENVSPDEIDLALIPGLAFDLAGGRLGRGQGYYDRLLGHSRFQGVKLGLCWEYQIVPMVPRSNSDILMDGIITERRTCLIADKCGSMLDKAKEKE